MPGNNVDVENALRLIFQNLVDLKLGKRLQVVLYKINFLVMKWLEHNPVKLHHKHKIQLKNRGLIACQKLLQAFLRVLVVKGNELAQKTNKQIRNPKEVRFINQRDLQIQNAIPNIASRNRVI